MTEGKSSKLQIVFSDRNFTQEEIKEVTDSFTKLLPIEKRYLLRESIGDLPAVIIITIIGTGFFQTIGSDLYEKAKEKIIKILNGKYSPTIEFKLKLEKTEIQIITSASDEQTVNKIFDTIADAKDLALTELNKKETPEMTQLNMRFDKSWKFVDGQNFNYDITPKVVKHYKYNEETGSWELTQDLSAYINAYFQAKDAEAKEKASDAKT